MGSVDSPAGPLPLDLHIETDSYVPYYQQIVDQVRAHIKSEALREGEVFHSEGEIATAGVGAIGQGAEPETRGRRRRDRTGVADERR